MRIVLPALTYFALIFSLGFVLGTIRTVWGAAALGESTFILIEVPIMLLASWLAARWTLARFDVAQQRRAFAVGAVAFALLMGAELSLTAALGESPSAWLASLTRPPGLYGFLGQIAFGLMPWVMLRTAKLAKLPSSFRE